MLSLAFVVAVASATKNVASPPFADPFIGFVDGMLTAIDPVAKGKIAPCINNTNNGYGDVRMFIRVLANGIDTGNYTEIVSSFGYVQTALTAARQAAIDCNEPQLAADLEAVAVLLLTNPIGVFDKLLPNAPAVLSDLEGAIAAFGSGDVWTAGYDIGSVVVFLMPAPSKAARRTAAPSPAGSDPYIAFLNGMLDALEPVVNGTIQPCLHDVDGGYQDVQKFIRALSQGISTGNVTEIIASFQYVRSAIEAIRDAANMCNEPALARDLQYILDNVLSNPIVFLEKLLPHAPTILADLEAAVSAFGSGDTYTAGYNIGSVLVFMFPTSRNSKIPSPPAADPFIAFVNGMLDAVEPSVNGSVKPCITGVDGGYADVGDFIRTARAGITSGNITEILAAFSYLQSAVTALSQAARDCNAPQLAADLEFIATRLLTNPIALLEKLLPHMPSVLTNLQGAVAAFESGDTYTAGFDVGSILILLFPSSK